MLTHFLKERTTVVLNMEWLPVRGSKGSFCNLRSKYQKYDWWVWPVYCILFLCAVLCCAVLSCVVLRCAVLCGVVVVVVALRCVLLYFTVLYCNALHSLQYSIKHSTNDIVAINIVFSKMQDARYLPLLHLVLSFITSIYLSYNTRYSLFHLQLWAIYDVICYQ